MLREIAFLAIVSGRYRATLLRRGYRSIRSCPPSVFRARRLLALALHDAPLDYRPFTNPLPANPYITNKTELICVKSRRFTYDITHSCEFVPMFPGWVVVCDAGELSAVFD